MAAPAIGILPSFFTFPLSPPPPPSSPSPIIAPHFLSGSIALKSLFTFLSNDSSHLQIAPDKPLPSSPSLSSTSKKDEDCVVGPFCPRYPSSDILSFSPQKTQWSFLRNRVFVTMRASAFSHPMQAFPGNAASRRIGIRAVSNNYNGAPLLMDEQARFGEVVRTTKETDVKVCINLDGSGISDCDTGIPFLDHMLDQLASHGLFDLTVQAKGDLHIDDHHTNEDVALALGTALLQALGDRKGIYRFGDFSAPLDEAVIHVVLDLSGRPYLGHNLCIPSERVGTYDTQLVEHFFQSLVNTSGMTLHIFQLSGKNSHHIIEATFKAFARALRGAVTYDERRKGRVPSSKGVLSRV